MKANDCAMYVFVEPQKECTEVGSAKKLCAGMWIEVRGAMIPTCSRCKESKVFV